MIIRLTAEMPAGAAGGTPSKGRHGYGGLDADADVEAGLPPTSPAVPPPPADCSTLAIRQLW